MRRRGYDVTAQPTFKGDTLPETAYRDNNNAYWGRWQKAFKGSKAINVGGNSNNEVVENIRTKMRGYGTGSRGVLSVHRGRNGHVFNVEYSKSGLHFIDAQTGARYSPRNVFSKVEIKDITLVRTDNLRISSSMKDFVWTGRGRK